MIFPFFGKLQGFSKRHKLVDDVMEARLFGTPWVPRKVERFQWFFKHFLKGGFSYGNARNLCGIRNLQFDFFMRIANIVISPYLAAFVCEWCIFEALNRFGLIVSSGAIISAT